MSRCQFSIGYAGKDKSPDHGIDIDLLAPAMVAFGKLMHEANAEFNGQQAKASVSLISDCENKGFHVDVKLGANLINRIRSILRLEKTKNAKELVEWIGITDGIDGSYLGYLKWKKGRKTLHVDGKKDEHGNDQCRVMVAAENDPITIHQKIYNLSLNRIALQATQDMFLPLSQESFDRVEIREKRSLMDRMKGKLLVGRIIRVKRLLLPMLLGMR